MKASLSLQPSIVRFPAAVFVALLLTASFAGCSKTPERDLHVSVINHVRVDGGKVFVQGEGDHQAKIGADGALSIDGRAITLTAVQQAASRRYYEHAVGIGLDGAAMGKAGAAIAGKAVSSALEGISSGKTDEIGPKIEAEAQKLETSAKKLCGRVASLRGAEAELGASLPEFKPFVRIDADAGSDCRG